MDCLAELFGMQRRRLTYCFRCPRRVLFSASQINRGLRAPENAKRGHVAVVVSDNTAATVHALVRKHSEYPNTLFAARTNQILLDLLVTAFKDAPSGVRLHWLSPNVQRLMRAVVSEGGETTLARYLDHVQTTQRANPERLLLRVLEIGIRLEGAPTAVGSSRWLSFLLETLSEPEQGGVPLLTLATVHAIKGMAQAALPHRKQGCLRSNSAMSSSSNTT